MSESELRHLKTINKDDELQLLQTLINLNKLAGKVAISMRNLHKLIETSAVPNMITDSQFENERRLLHVKSDHQLFLVKDLTQEVTKILEDANATKQEFDYIHQNMINKQFDNYSGRSHGSESNVNHQIDKTNQLMNDMSSFVEHLEQLFHELIDRSTTIIENGDLVEYNYVRLLKIVNGKSDQIKKIEELYDLNEEHLRTILKLRKDLVNLKKSKETTIPQLQLEKVNSHQTRPHSVTNLVPRHEQVRAASSTSLKQSIRSDNFGKSIQNFDAEKDNFKLKDLIREKETINEALENEIIRKNEVIRNMHQTIENTQDRDFTDKKDYNEALEQQRIEFQQQFQELNDQYELKCMECRKLVDELNSKDRRVRDSQGYPDNMDYDVVKLKDDNSQLSREVMICRDEANKYKMRLNQVYNEIDSFKASIFSYEKQCNKLKQLNSELNKNLSDERNLNISERNKVQEQVMHFQKKVDELEGYSVALESNRENQEAQDYTSRTMKTPGSVMSNNSGMFGSKNFVQRHPIDTIIDELRLENTQLKHKITNYQNQINKIQGEKQQMYQSLNQLKLGNLGDSLESHNLKSGFNTPVTKAPTTTIKKNHTYRPSTNDKNEIQKMGKSSNTDPISGMASNSHKKDKSDSIIEYLRAEITHLRDKYKQLDLDFVNYKAQVKSQKGKAPNLGEFMNEILRPAKDLIYQLCSDPHISESFFYKEDEKYHGLEGKFCLDVVKIFNSATDRIVELRTIIGHKDQQLKEEISAHKSLFAQERAEIEQETQEHYKDYQDNLRHLNGKIHEFAQNLKILTQDLDQSKIK